MLQVLQELIDLVCAVYGVEEARNLDTASEVCAGHVMEGMGWISTSFDFQSFNLLSEVSSLDFQISRFFRLLFSSLLISRHLSFLSDSSFLLSPLLISPSPASVRCSPGLAVQSSSSLGDHAPLDGSFETF